MNTKKNIAFMMSVSLIASMSLALSGCNPTPPEVTEVYTPKVETSVETTIVTTEETEPPLVLLPEAEERMERYEHYAGWINIPGIVDEPIVQYSDNDYYLNRNPDQQKDVAGSIYADFRCLLNTRKRSGNIVLYGHNQKDGSRFGQLDFYKWNPLTYYQQKPVVYVDTAYEKRVYKICSMFIINTKPEHDTRPLFDYHNYIDLTDEARFNEFADQIKKRSLLVIPDVDIEYGDRFITLSTCSTEFESSRFVIVARELREGESAEVDTSTAKVNDNPLYPEIIYKYQGGSYRE